MAFLNDTFSKEKSDSPEGAASQEIPTGRVLTMRDQGLTNNQIVEALQREGYSLDLINNAINQADIKEGVLTQTKGDNMPDNQQDNSQEGQGGQAQQDQTPAQGQGQQQAPQSPPPMPPQGGPQAQAGQQAPPQGPGQMPQMGAQQGPPPMPPSGGPGGMDQGQGATEERIQEIAEAIIDEKWSELISNVNKIVEWKDETESRITKIEQQMKDLKESFDKLHEGVLGRISEYDKGIKEIGTEIKALEKVFQKILPGFVENVNELSRITSKMKGGKK
ncbi:MAG: hypothetical protein R6U32_02460 [Candidatus Woesearchaeota archaeon]